MACLRFLVAGLLGTTIPVAAQSRGEFDFRAVDAYIESGIEKTGLVGGAILVVHKGEVVHEKFFGYTPETDLPIASSSKWLSAAVIMTLVDQKRIDLDAPVTRYLPYFAEATDARLRAITVRQMFSHTTGLRELKADWDYTITMDQFARKAAAEGKLAADPGAEIRYGSTSMQIAGRIAEVVSGTGWHELFRERIAEPCEMPKTRYGKDAKSPNPMLAGGAFSTLRDYGHFLEMIRGKGMYKGRRVLSAAAVSEMQKKQTGDAPLVIASNDRMGRKSPYGLGEWVDQQAEDGRTLQVSSPGAFGFRPWLNLERDLYGVWMMDNRTRKTGAAAQPFDPWEMIRMIHAVVDGPRGSR